MKDYLKAQPIILSNPGSEKVVLDTSTIQLMECDSQDKHRYCVVEKGTPPAYPNQYMNAAGDRVHIITREVFQIFLTTLTNLSRQLSKYKADAESLAIKSEAQEMLITALRKHGIID